MTNKGKINEGAAESLRGFVGNLATVTNLKAQEMAGLRDKLQADLDAAQVKSDLLAGSVKTYSGEMPAVQQESNDLKTKLVAEKREGALANGGY